MSIVCSPEQFNTLKTKAYRNIPRKLLTTVIKELPDYAMVVYLTLYDLSQLNEKYKNVVLVSQCSLAEHLSKSIRSIGRALRKLKDEGYIELQDKINSIYAVNIIRICCPKFLAEQIIEKESGRNLSLPSCTYSTTKLAFQPITSEKDLEYLTTELNTKPSYLSNNVGSECLYQQYQTKLKQLRLVGMSPLKASQEAFKIFTDKQLKIIQRHILNPSGSQTEFIAAHEQKTLNNLDKNVQHIRVNNNRIRKDLMLTIDKYTTVDNLTSFEPSGINPHVNFKNLSDVVNYSIQERLTVIKKLKAMQRDGEIHRCLQPKYLNLVALITEVLAHIGVRNLNRTTSFKHALNAAAKMIREGIWSTPKKLLYQQSLRKEQEALIVKQKEYASLQSFRSEFHSFVNDHRYPYAVSR